MNYPVLENREQKQGLGTGDWEEVTKHISRVENRAWGMSFHAWLRDFLVSGY